jgi:hypothetical protein
MQRLDCQARPTQDGMVCAVCRIRWDRDDERECPRMAQDEPVPYRSALAPARFPPR